MTPVPDTSSGTDRRLITVVALNAGLAAVAVGLFLPWATVAGDQRTGPQFAADLLGLPDIDRLAAVPAFACWWYAIPLLALGTWVSQFQSWPPAASRWTRVFGVLLVVASGVFYAGLVVRGVGGPAVGASVSLAGAVVAAGASFFGRSA
jgi:hypothetical protein